VFSWVPCLKTLSLCSFLRKLMYIHLYSAFIGAVRKVYTLYTIHNTCTNETTG
jgi:hypothetical protein